jgi:arabinogalactan endo-1,4-beta-galactosidase
VVASFTVTASETLNVVSVRSGQAVCLSPGADIRGSITVQEGGSIDIEGASIHGSISASGAGVVRVCHSKINGAVTVSSSTGPVDITSNTAEVESVGNTVNGSLTIIGNTESLVVKDDTVSGTENVQ